MLRRARKRAAEGRRKAESVARSSPEGCGVCCRPQTGQPPPLWMVRIGAVS